jgi:hypothetical protein
MPIDEHHKRYVTEALALDDANVVLMRGVRELPPVKADDGTLWEARDLSRCYYILISVGPDDQHFSNALRLALGHDVMNLPGPPR